jgi:hypothetical protein
MFTGVTRMLAVFDLWHAAAAFHPVFVGKCRQEISGAVTDHTVVIVLAPSSWCRTVWRPGHVATQLRQTVRERRTC